jgi:hypothetical protein
MYNHPISGRALRSDEINTMNFLKDNWLYIIAPMALILGAVAWFVFFSEPLENGTSAHQYNLFDG